MTNRFFLLVAVAFLLVFGLGVAAVVGITSMTDHLSVAAEDETVRTPTAEKAPQPVVAPLTGDAQIRTARLDPPIVASEPVSASVVIVGMADINRLAAAVHLGDLSAPVGKDVWTAQLPIAQKLQNGMCDCDQRNWLNHFVQAAQEAVSGSDHFRTSVQLLAKLRRANSDLASAGNSR